MTNQDNRPIDSEDLRQKAEALARERTTGTSEDSTDLSPEDIRKTLHELRVHQIELELQNEELRHAKAVLEESRARYIDLYDMAPVCYLTLSEEGLILEANLTASTLLGEKRGMMIKQPIFRFIFKEDQDIYYLHRKKLFETGEPQECELRLMKPDGSVFWAHLTATAVQAADSTCVNRLVISDITERKQAEQAEKESEERFRQMFTNAPMPYQSLDEQGNFLDINKTFLDVLGYHREELIGKNFADILHPDWRDHFKENFPKFKAVGEILGVEFEMVKKDGSTILVYFNGKIQRDDQGQFLRTHCIFQDITELKRIEAESQSQAALIISLLDSIPDIIFIKDMQGVFLGCNTEFSRHVGKDKEDIIGGTDYDLYPKETADFFRTKDKLMLKQGRPRHNEEWIFYPDGRKILLDTLKTPYRDDQGEVVGIIGVCRDITDRKKTEEELQLERERLFLLLESFPGFIYLQSPDYSVRYANQYFIKQFGNPRGRLCYEVMWGRTAPCKVCPTFKVFDTKKPYVWEWQQAPDGKSYVIHDYPFIDSDGTELVLEIGVDITDRKMAEEEIKNINQQLEQVNAEKDKLFAIIAHDLKSPISGVYSTSQLLSQGAGSISQEDISLISAEMLKSSKNALELLNDLMQWARLSQGGMNFSPEKFNLHVIINEILSTARDLAEKKEIFIKYDIPQDILVLADQPMFSAIVRNLVFNAVKFTNQGGNIFITARKKDSDVEICVQDDGIGMNEAILSTAFSVDKKKRQLGTDGEKGTGLGLVLCKEFVEKHGGKIWLESEPGKGTKVFFTLPGKSGQK